MTVRPDPLTETGSTDPFDRFFTGCINIRDNEVISIRKSREKFIEKLLRPGIAVRLKHHNDPVFPHLPRRRQSFPDFRRMMAVVIHHGHSVHLTLDLQPAVDSHKRFQSFTDYIKGHIQFTRYSNGGQGIGDIKPPGNVQCHLP